MLGVLHPVLLLAVEDDAAERDLSVVETAAPKAVRQRALLVHVAADDDEVVRALDGDVHFGDELLLETHDAAAGPADGENTPYISL